MHENLQMFDILLGFSITKYVFYLFYKSCNLNQIFFVISCIKSIVKWQKSCLLYSMYVIVN